MLIPVWHATSSHPWQWRTVVSYVAGAGFNPLPLHGMPGHYDAAGEIGPLLASTSLAQTAPRFTPTCPLINLAISIRYQTLVREFADRDIYRSLSRYDGAGGARRIPYLQHGQVRELRHVHADFRASCGTLSSLERPSVVSFVRNALSQSGLATSMSGNFC